MRKVAVTAAAGLLVLAGCSGEPPRATPGTLPPATSPPPSASAAAPSRAVDVGAPSEVARGISVPWGLAFLPGGDALVAERNSARVLRIPAAGGRPQQVYRV